MGQQNFHQQDQQAGLSKRYSYLLQKVGMRLQTAFQQAIKMDLATHPKANAARPLKASRKLGNVASGKHTAVTVGKLPQQAYLHNSNAVPVVLRR